MVCPNHALPFIAGHPLWQARAPGREEAQIRPQPAFRCGGARCSPLRRSACAELLLAERGKQFSQLLFHFYTFLSSYLSTTHGIGGLLSTWLIVDLMGCVFFQDSVYKYYEVIMVDPMHKVVRSDPRINWICNPVHVRTHCLSAECCLPFSCASLLNS